MQTQTLKILTKLSIETLSRHSVFILIFVRIKFLRMCINVLAAHPPTIKSLVNLPVLALQPISVWFSSDAELGSPQQTTVFGNKAHKNQTNVC